MSQTKTLAVVGAGNMGSGIAQKIATEGYRVILVDLNEAQIERGMTNIKQTLKEAVERKIVTPQQVDDIMGRLCPTTDWTKLAEADLVVEAVFEDLNVKKDVFRRLSDACRPDTILGTNTSSFYVRDVAAVVKNPERVVGLHYFYHPAKNRLVEVVPHATTSTAATAKAWAIQEAIGKTPIWSKDAPGFIVNRYFVPWLNEAVRLLAQGVADIPTIEAAAKQAFRIGMGPFELMNVTGVPIALHAATTLGRELGPFYAPEALLASQVAKKENWSLAGSPVEAKFQTVADRLLGVVFHVAAEIVDGGIGSIEDNDIGARVGLRWSMGPFELMNRLGIAKACDLAAAAVAPFGLKLPQCMATQKAAGKKFEFKLVDVQKDGDIATLAINRPDAMNAINEDVVAQLTARFAEVDRDPTIKGIVIAGKGKAFIAGADIRYFVKNIEAKNFDAIQKFTERGQDLLNAFAKSKKPVIARLDGLSLGGGSELALACDWIVATDKGSMGFPETGIGIYPGLGGTQRLSRRIGVPLARWLVLTGAPIDAKAGAEIGLVDSITTHEGMPEAIKTLVARGKAARNAAPTPTVPKNFAAIAECFGQKSLAELKALKSEDCPDKGLARALKSIAFKAPIAMEIADSLICDGAKTTLDAGLQMELANLGRIFRTADAYLGLSTLGKSKPTYTGT